jgi:hypothetical protein
MNTERQLNPSDLTDEQIDRIAFAVIGKLEKYTTNGIEKPLTRQKAAEHIGLGVDMVDKMKRDGVLQPYYFPGSNVPFYYASEINEALRGRKRRSKP